MDILKAALDFLLKLANTHNTVALVIFTVLIGTFLAAIVYLFWIFLKKDSFDKDFPLLFLRVRLYGGKGLKLGKRRYRKVLYVKVLYLSDQRSAAAPFYVRSLPRAGRPARQVDVFDEAVYYTLKLFPEDRDFSSETDHSSGFVDPRVIIPWDPTSDQNRDTLGPPPEQAQMQTGMNTDTMLSVSHFLNGMQNREQQFCTIADEDTDSLRIVVDFSSVPSADQIVKALPARLWRDGAPVVTDNVSYADLGRSIYMAHCRDAKSGSTLRMDVVLTTWPDSADEKPGHSS